MSRLKHRSIPLWQSLLILSLLLPWTLTACVESAGHPMVREAVSGDYIRVYFTAPQAGDGHEARDGGIDFYLVSVIDSAQQSVDVAAYDLDLETVAEALIRAQERGVTVRLVTDESNADEEAIASLRQAGIPVVARPESSGGIMHDKFVVVDGQWIWTGSWNLTYNCTYRNNNNAVLIASRNLAEDYHTEFEEMFAGQFGASSPANTPHPRLTIASDGVEVAQIEVYFAPEDGVAQHVIDEISAAESSVRLMAFQFTSTPIADALIAQMERGVEVEGVFEARSVEDEYNLYGLLLDHGAQIWTDGNPYLLHHKVMIIDDHTVILGSYNFSNNAERNNDENLLIIHDPQVAAAFIAEYDRVLQQVP
jgi:phosphatidylserine/phosphatidylglycerophosphate/cardiolipin synthase-like enzyme